MCSPNNLPLESEMVCVVKISSWWFVLLLNCLYILLVIFLKFKQGKNVFSVKNVILHCDYIYFKIHCYAICRKFKYVAFFI